MEKYTQRSCEVEAAQFNGKDLLPGMVRKDVKDAFDYQTRRFGIQTPRGFMTMDVGDWLVMRPVTPTECVIDTVCTNEYFKTHYTHYDEGKEVNPA